MIAQDTVLVRTARLSNLGRIIGSGVRDPNVYGEKAWPTRTQQESTFMHSKLQDIAVRDKVHTIISYLLRTETSS